MRYLIACLILLWVMGACIETPKEGLQPAITPYFDLKAYMSAEMERLGERENVRKVAVVNGKREEQTTATFKPDTELAIFADADINRTAWLDKYRSDSLRSNDGQLQQLIYTALDSQLITKRLAIDFNSRAEVSQIRIDQSDLSRVADNRKVLIYEPQRGYQIRSRQDVLLVGENELKLEVLF